MNARLPSDPAHLSAQREQSATGGEQETALPDRRELRRLTEEVGDALARRGETLAVGETSAGGALAGALHVDGQPRTQFRGGLVLYAGNDAPLAREMDGIASKHGVVSEEYAAALARYVRGTFGCQWALAESGIAGPQTGRRSAKPVGMVCLAVAGPVGEGKSAQERGTRPGATGHPIAKSPDGRARGTSPRAPGESGKVSQDPQGRGTSPRATGDWQEEREQVYTATRLMPDCGREANQRQFALEALRLLRRALLARPQE